MRCRVLIAVVVFLLPNLHAAASHAASQPDSSSPAAFVGALLDAADGSASFAELQLAIDKSVDPAVDLDAAHAELDSMVAIVKRMLATIPPEAASTSLEKMKALRTFIYESGWWNDHRPFGYDMDDPLGQKNFHSRLLSHYIDTRKGNCVSMPTLFLVLGERLGLRVTLSTAPLHVFVKWTNDAGQTFNLETTSGAGGTRDSYYRERMPMTDEAIANGVYMKTLSRKETVAVMATTLLDDLLRTGRNDEAIAVADALLEAYPANAYVLAKKGTAHYRLLKENFIEKYPTEGDIPAEELPYAISLHRANQEAFAKAEALGWREPELK
jgi:regulator of sirC expression with transglutaminase-like and TPR domain